MAARINLILIFIICSVNCFAFELTCEQIFKIEQLSIEQAIDHLSQLRLELDLARARGDRSAHIQTVERDYNSNLARVINTAFDQHQLTKQDVIDRIRENILKIQNHSTAVQENREARATQIDAVTNVFTNAGRQLIFQEITSGSFYMGRPGRERLVEISENFSMSSTLTTQYVWAAIVKEAQNVYPKKFAELQMDPSHFKGENRPVEMVSHDDIKLWLKAANKLIEDKNPIAKILFPGIKKNSKLRLPTAAEWQYVAQAGKDIPDASLEDYAVLNAKETEPVATHKPITVGGHEFFDLFGNVAEWVGNWYSPSVQSGPNPTGPKKGLYRLTYGGSWKTTSDDAHYFEEDEYSPETRLNTIGFRVVRVSR